MKTPSFADAFEVLCLQAADDGRGPVLFGESLARARREVRAFMVGSKFPDVYFEFPLVGDPFLDVTVLYGELEPGTHIESMAADDSDAMLAWCGSKKKEFGDISFGFELDTKCEELPRAAIHFQPRTHVELVEPFCEIVGEPAYAQLYLETARRMPEGWPLSFFGMFRGRPGAPLRICGYLDVAERDRCANDPCALARAFDAIGFSAYDDVMLQQVSQLMRKAPGSVDFQFDVYPDGTMGDVFAIDLNFDIEQPEAVQGSYATGPAAQVMGQLESWGAADQRWRMGGDAAFARSIPVELDDGGIGLFSFTLMPHWAKARWTKGVLQPSKLYMLGGSGLLNRSNEDGGSSSQR